MLRSRLSDRFCCASSHSAATPLRRPSIASTAIVTRPVFAGARIAAQCRQPLASAIRLFARRLGPLELLVDAAHFLDHPMHDMAAPPTAANAHFTSGEIRNGGMTLSIGRTMTIRTAQQGIVAAFYNP